MRRLTAFLRAVWDFVVGDDWRIAIAVVVGLGLAALISSLDVSAWWIPPIVVLAILGRSVFSAAGAARRGT